MPSSPNWMHFYFKSWFANLCWDGAEAGGLQIQTLVCVTDWVQRPTWVTQLDPASKRETQGCALLVDRMLGIPKALDSISSTAGVGPGKELICSWRMVAFSLILALLRWSWLPRILNTIPEIFISSHHIWVFSQSGSCGFPQMTWPLPLVSSSSNPPRSIRENLHS